MPSFRQFFRDESGATAIEYTLVVSLISAGIIGTITIVGIDLGHGFDDISNALRGGPVIAAGTVGGGPTGQ